MDKMNENKKKLRPSFLLTENLSKLARYLRMLGYDAVVYKKISFHNRIRLTNKDRRIYLTRCRKEATSKIKFSRFLIHSEKIEDQIHEIRKFLVYSEEYIFSRCIICNKLVYPISKEKVKNLIPEYIYNDHQQFTICRKCGRIYWHGTHYEKMKKNLKMWI